MANENDIGGRVGLDVTDFKAGIAELNRQIKVVDSGFKAAAAGMDDWGKSEEGLQERISSLNQITDLQRQKVAALTSQYEKIAAEKGDNSRAAQDLQIRINKETEALNKNLTELSKTTKALDDMGKESLQAAGNVDKVGESAEELSVSFKGVAAEIIKSDIFKAISSKALDAAKSLFGFSSDSSKAMNKFQVQTGQSAESLEDFKDIATSLYKQNLGESIEDVASAMATVKQVTGEVGPELEEATRTALLMRDAFGFEVSESINTVNSLVQNFGISADEAYTLIAQGAQMGANKNGDLLDVLNEYAPHFAQLGLDANEFTDTLIQGAAAGAFQIDKMGDAVKEFGIRSKDGSDSSRKGFEALGLDADKMFATFAAGGPQASAAFQEVIDRLGGLEDPLAQNQAGVALFGTMFEDLGVSAIQALGDIDDNADMSRDTLEKINDIQYSDFGSTLEGVKRNLISALAEPIEKTVLPRIKEFGESIKGMDFTPIVNGFAWILDNAGNIAAGLAGIAAAMITHSAVQVVDALVKSYRAYQLASEGATIAQWALNAAQAANPIGLIITAIAAVVAAIIVLWNTNDEFRNAIITAWEAIKGAFIAVIDWVKGNWANLLLLLTNPIGGALKLLYDMNPKFREWVDGIFNTIVDTLKKLPGQVGDFFNELPDKIGYALGLVIGTLASWGIEAVDWVKTDVPKIISSVVSFFAGLPGKIYDELAKALTRFGNWASDLLTTAQTEIPRVVNSITGFFMDLPGKMVDIGGDMVRGLWDGIKNMTGWIKDKVGDFAGGVVGGIKDALGIHSPSRVMRDEVGKMVGLGMAEGITDSVRAVSSAMDGLNETVSGSGQGIIRQGVTAGATNNTTNTVNVTVQYTGNQRAENDIRTLAQGIADMVNGQLGSVGVAPA